MTGIPQQIVILGGRGDGLVVAQAVRDLASARGGVALAGFLDDALVKNTIVAGVPILGTLDEWRTLPADCVFYPALHKVKQMPARSKRIRDLAIPEARWATVVHPTACIASDVKIGYGTFIASYTTLQPGARVGCFASIRAGANVGHDATVGDFAYMGPNATLAGRARLEEGSHLGPNAAVLDGVRVGRFAVVGLCSAVTKNVDDFITCIGVPAQPIALDRARSGM